MPGDRTVGTPARSPPGHRQSGAFVVIIPASSGAHAAGGASTRFTCTTGCAAAAGTFAGTASDAAVASAIEPSDAAGARGSPPSHPLFSPWPAAYTCMVDTNVKLISHPLLLAVISGNRIMSLAHHKLTEHSPSLAVSVAGAGSTAGELFFFFDLVAAASGGAAEPQSSHNSIF